MTKPRLIALCSPAMGSGKTTAAQYLCSAHNFIPLAFATALKQMTTSLLLAAGMNPGDVKDHVYGSRKEDVIPELGVSSRWLQQTLGTDWGRKLINPNIWVNITMAAAKRHLDEGHSVVIDDLRFPNEFHAVEAEGGDCRRIVRPAAKVTSAHVSEGQLDSIVMPEIWNTGSQDDLFRAIDALL